MRLLLTPSEQAALGPKTLANLTSEHRYYSQRPIRQLAAYVVAERNEQLATDEQMLTLVLTAARTVLLSDVLDYWKAGKLTEGRADQYGTEAKAAKTPSKLLRLLVTLYFEINIT